MEQLITTLVESGVLKNSAIIEAFRHTDRAQFVPAAYAEESYGDYPLPIGYGQTISQPTTVAFMLELLQPQVGEKILDVGSGSGWTAALLAYLVGPEGMVWGVERIPELVTFACDNVKRIGRTNVTMVTAEREIGLSKQAPFDRILVSAAATSLPQALARQLRAGGTMVLPVEHAVWRVRKESETRAHIETYEGFSFVPLIP